MDANAPLSFNNDQSMFTSGTFEDGTGAGSGGGMDMFGVSSAMMAEQALFGGALPDDQTFLTHNWLFNSEQINGMKIEDLTALRLITNTVC